MSFGAIVNAVLLGIVYMNLLVKQCVHLQGNFDEIWTSFNEFFFLPKFNCLDRFIRPLISVFYAPFLVFLNRRSAVSYSHKRSKCVLFIHVPDFYALI